MCAYLYVCCAHEQEQEHDILTCLCVKFKNKFTVCEFGISSCWCSSLFRFSFNSLSASPFLYQSILHDMFLFHCSSMLLLVYTHASCSLLPSRILFLFLVRYTSSVTTSSTNFSSFFFFPLYNSFIYLFKVYSFIIIFILCFVSVAGQCGDHRCTLAFFRLLPFLASVWCISLSELKNSNEIYEKKEMKIKGKRRKSEII